MTPRLPCLAVKDFAKHQHYRDRRPPWIKLYASLLTDAAFLQLHEVAQAQLVKLWILASQFGNPLPNNPKLLAGKIGCQSRFRLDELVASGFLIPCEQDACAPLADSEHSASGPVRAREETEDREQRTDSSIGPSFEASRLELIVLLGGSVRAVQECETFFAGLPNDTKRLSWARSLVTGMHGGGAPAIPPDALLSGMAEFNMADRNQYPYNARVFRGFVDRRSEPPNLEREAPRRNGKHPNPGAQQVANILGRSE